MILWKQFARTVHLVLHNLLIWFTLLLSIDSSSSRDICLMRSSICSLFDENLTRIAISVVADIVSDRSFGSFVVSFTAGLKEWQWQWVTYPFGWILRICFVAPDFCAAYYWHHHNIVLYISLRKCEYAIKHSFSWYDCTTLDI